MSLAVILDENIPPQVAEYLQSKPPAWDVCHVRDVGLSGASDQVIFEWAQQNGAIVITFDEDFADTRMYPTGSHAATEDQTLQGSLVIIDNHRIRIRRAAQHG